MCDVLVLDDDVLLREIMADTLRDDGLDVMTAFDAETALSILRDFGARVLVADMQLGDGVDRENGHLTAEVATRLCPTLRVVYISGNADCLRDRALTPRERALPKPFIGRDLVGAVRAILA